MSSTKLTPLEWFAEEVSKSLQFGFLSRQRYNELREQAKEMEKEQREKDLESGFDTGRLYQGREGDTTLGQLKLNILNIL